MIVRGEFNSIIVLRNERKEVLCGLDKTRRENVYFEPLESYPSIVLISPFSIESNVSNGKRLLYSEIGSKHLLTAHLNVEYEGKLESKTFDSSLKRFIQNVELWHVPHKDSLLKEHITRKYRKIYSVGRNLAEETSIIYSLLMKALEPSTLLERQ